MQPPNCLKGIMKYMSNIVNYFSKNRYFFRKNFRAFVNFVCSLIFLNLKLILVQNFSNLLPPSNFKIDNIVIIYKRPIHNFCHFEYFQLILSLPRKANFLHLNFAG